MLTAWLKPYNAYILSNSQRLYTEAQVYLSSSFIHKALYFVISSTKKLGRLPMYK